MLSSCCNLYIYPDKWELKVEKEYVLCCVMTISASVRLTHVLRGLFIYRLTWALIVCWSTTGIIQL